MKAVWSIAGHDPLGAAGIQVDLRVAWQLGLPLRTLIASFTAQNHQAMPLCEAVSDGWFKDQWDALRAHETPEAIKLGLLAEPRILRQLGVLLGSLPPATPIICDPVLAASSGRDWGSNELLAAYREYIMPRVTLFTPNRIEAERFLGYALDSREAIVRGARELLSWGARAVLIKGGHSALERDYLVDYFDDGARPFFLRSVKKAGNFRGTGCSLSTAIACSMARGLDLREATVMAHSFLQQAIQHTPSSEASILAWPPTQGPISPLSYDGDFPGTAFAGIERIGFYPIVPSLEWVKRLLPTGIKTIQLRIKDKSRQVCAQEISEANALCRRADVRLFVNDHWRIALAEGAYGVHLGQEDLDTLDPNDLLSIRRAGLRLGVSTHSYEEVARAASIRPTYIALGPIFETSCKSMRFGPQGIDRIGLWKALCPQIPLVAIGGLKLEHAAQVLNPGADGVAVVSDVLQHPAPEQRTREWLRFFAH